MDATLNMVLAPEVLANPEAIKNYLIAREAEQNRLRYLSSIHRWQAGFLCRG
jgi:hypothetical protein